MSTPERNSGERLRHRYAFGNFTLDRNRRVLCRGEEELALRAKTFDVLAFLVEHHGELATKAALMEAVWPETAVTDNSLAQCIVEIRRALGDDSQQLIRTVAGRGYSFAGLVKTRVVEDAPPLAPKTTAPFGLPLVAPAPAMTQLKRFGPPAALALTASVLIGLNVFRPAPPIRGEPSYTPITSFTDSAVAPALSPDGRMVAFYRSSSGFHTPDQIYVKLLPNGDPVQLTNDPRLKYGLAFSPDGSRIAYTVVEPGLGWNTVTISPLGGSAPSLFLSNAAGLTWLDPRRVLFSEIRGTGVHMGIVTAVEDRSEVRSIYFPKHERAMAHYSYASPDRKWAIIVEMDPLWQPCRLIPLDGTPSVGRQVGPRGKCTSAAWSRDGKWMYFGAEVDGEHHLWRQRFQSEHPEQITFGPTEEDGIALAPDGRSLITSIGLRESAVWIHNKGGERPLTSQGHVTAIPTSLSRVTNYLGGPSTTFSFDGKFVFFLLRRDSLQAASELWRTEVVSGHTEVVLRGASVEQYDISNDGSEVVYTTKPSGEASQLWLAKLNGESPPTLIASDGEGAPRFGPDGKLLFQFTDGKNNYLGQIGKDGSSRSKVVPDPIIDFYTTSRNRRWAIAGIAATKGRATVAIPINGGPPRRICSNYCPVAWAPDGKFVYIGLVPESHTSRGKTLVLPVLPGEAFPRIPVAGVRDLHAEDEFPNAQVIHAWDISPGSDPSVFAYVKTTVHRNLYRIALP